MSVNNRVVGPIVLACAVIGLHECARGLRWVNLVVGVWLLFAPWVLHYEALPAFNNMCTGLLVIGSAVVRGRSCLCMGDGWRGVFARHSQTPTAT